ncbi:UDP-N-acetyl glucosamine 2-epimerase [Actinokineospora sp. UTMC 2448]|uniref:UDP-N-acetyl glucosamine 2-epimerase n=1 Tax=Actinokineospora sp. UTMC 2448 TaxID=2268449 RepID=UPI002164C8CB|nr:UDP-N-acetylglucosamine 2-epimerase [Actinokineospora sp. UTMC 2448]
MTMIQQAARPARPTRRRPPARPAAPRRGGAAMVLGSRQEILALAPVMRELRDLAGVVRVRRTDPAILGDEGLAGPLAAVGAEAVSRSCRLAAAMDRLDQVFAADRPDVVVVRGATDTALAGALAARSHGVPVVHVEAGLRSRDLGQPEEHNRVLVDRAAEVLCAPTPVTVANLEADGLGDRNIRLTGTTTVESVRHRLMPEAQRRAVVRKWGLEPDGYVLATLDRPENTDDEALFAITNQLSGVAEAGYPVVLAAHPRTRAAAIRAGVLASGMNVRVVNRLWHSEFLALARHCGLLVSDSGAVQEEATVVKRPILVVRRSTERPEVLRDFGRLVGPGDDITAIALDWLADGERRARLAELPSPFGDGRGGERIADAVRHVALAARG